MRKKPPQNVVITLPPSSGQLTKIIRDLNEKRQVRFSLHAKQRQKERSGVAEMGDLEVFRVLECGTLQGRAMPGKYPGDWIVKVEFRPAGHRKIRVVTAIINKFSELLIISVMWTDK